MIERASRRGLSATSTRARCRGCCRACRRRSSSIGLERAAFLHASDIARIDPARSATSAARRDARSRHPRVRARGPGDPRAGREGADRHEGRAADDPHLDPVALPRAAADGERRRRVGAHRGRSRARRACSCSSRADRSRDAPGGYIVRTAAEGASREALRADMAFLHKLWKVDRGDMARARRPASCVYEDLPLPLRVLRDSSSADIGARARGFARRPTRA